MSITWKNVTIRLGDLKPWEQNPRQSTAVQSKRILQSMADFGQVQTVAISPEGEVYDGHQRLSALMAVHGADYELDARQSSRALTDYERRGLVLALHATAAGEWDWDELANWDLPSLLPLDFATEWLAGLNHDGAELANLLASEVDTGEETESDAEPQTSRADELQAEWGTEVGQLWQIGEHRLLIGDCTVAENVERLMGGEKAEGVLTDPPYGMKAVSSSGVLKARYGDDIAGDADPELARIVFKSLVPLKIPQIWWGANYYADATGGASCWLVWDKNNGGSDQADAELAWTNLSGVVRVFKIASEKQNRTHPTQKHPDLIKWCIEKLKNASVIYDPFGGSGTTMVACNQLGRQCRMMELSPAYGAVILQRMIDAFPTLDIYQVE